MGIGSQTAQVFPAVLLKLRMLRVMLGVANAKDWTVGSIKPDDC